MTIRMSTLTTAGLLGLLLALGPIAHAGDGCTKDKKASQSASLLGPTDSWGAHPATA